jgi:MoxR-like ATPase
MSDTPSVTDIESEIARVKPVVSRVREEIARVIVGQESMVDRLLIGLLANGHVLIEGVPGLAKTTAVQALSSALKLEFKRIQFTPDLLPSDLLGTQVYSPKDGTFSTHKGPIFTNIVLADEINRAPAKVQSALLEAMQERQVTLDGQSHPLPNSFMVLATQNPIEQEGTYPLPEAQSDRFLMKIRIDYPSREDEAEILRRTAGKTPILEGVASAEELQAARSVVAKIRMERVVEEYIVDLVRATRTDSKVADVGRLIEVGASPRATIALAATARAHAFLVGGRGYVTPDDVKAMAPDVLRHRIMLSYEAEADGIGPDDAIVKVLERVRTP